LAGTTSVSILRAWREMLAKPPAGALPKLWDGKAGERCVEAIWDVFKA
jgi:hypothetical protein